MKLSDAKALSRFTLLQVSESGHGKTTRALSATRFGSVKLIDLDGKLTAMRSRIPAEQQALIDFDVPKTYDELVALLDPAKLVGFSTVVIDTWSRAHDLTIEKHKSLNPKLVTLTLQDWGSVKSMNTNLLSRILSLPQNIIVNTHVGKDKDALDRAILTVGTTGSFGAMMPQYFNETHFLFYDGKFRVRGGRSNSIVANTALPEKLLDSNGLFIQNDLSVFDEIAYRGK